MNGCNNGSQLQLQLAGPLMNYDDLANNSARINAMGQIEV